MKLFELFHRTKTVAESDETKQQARLKSCYFTRERKMSFSSLVYYILQPGKESTQLGLNRFFRMLGVKTQMTQQAFSKARSHFSHLPFETMVRVTTQAQYSEECELKKWHGKNLFAIDGTTLALPDKANLRETFGGSGRKRDSATANVSILYDMENDWIADAEISPYPTSEKKNAENHINRLAELGIGNESVVIFDRGYPSAKLIEQLQAHGIGFLMRCRRKFNVVIDETHSNDFTLHFRGTIPLRVVRVMLPSGEIEVLASNLFDVPYEDFLTLYFRRWPIETKYDILKNKLELGNFSGYAPNAILQDFWACIHLANIVATAKAEADELVQARQGSAQNTYRYAPNTAQLVGSLKDHFIDVCLLPRKKQRDAALDRMRDEISRAVSPIRPGRSFWRNPWPRKAKFCFNTKSNI